MIAASISEHSWLLIFIAVYASAALLLSTLLGHANEAWPRLYWAFFTTQSFAFLGAFAIARLTHAMVIVRPRRLLQHVWNDFTANAQTHRSLAGGLPLVVLMPVFFSVFTSVKLLIPELSPFHWDVVFAQWDQVLHGGIAPWKILHPLVGRAWITGTLSVVYFSWFHVLPIVCLWQAFATKRPALRVQFFLSLLLVWVLLGNVAAIALSSAGPCFFGRATGLPDPYAPLMTYLHAANEIVPVWSVQIQDWLWQGYVQHDFGTTKGISAMPSIHVAVAFLFALLGWRVNRILGILFTAFCIVIMIGSVHLGWHYAADGYLAIAATYLIWRSAGWLVDRGIVGRVAHRQTAPAS